MSTPTQHGLAGLAANPTVHIIIGMILVAVILNWLLTAWANRVKARRTAKPATRTKPTPNARVQTHKQTAGAVTVHVHIHYVAEKE